jgi:hypothetical protein
VYPSLKRKRSAFAYASGSLDFEVSQKIGRGDASPAETVGRIIHDPPHIEPARIGIIVKGKEAIEDLGSWPKLVVEKCS